MIVLILAFLFGSADKPTPPKPVYYASIQEWRVAVDAQMCGSFPAPKPWLYTDKGRCPRWGID